MSQTKKRSFSIEFYEIVVAPTDDVTNAATGFKRLQSSSAALTSDINSYIREICDLRDENDPMGVSGVLRKFRTDNLPGVGSPGGLEEQLKLADGKGLIEKNHFRFFARQNVIGWQRNHNANSPMLFAKLLGRLWKTNVELNVLLVADPVKRVRDGTGLIRRLSLTVAKPKHGDFTPESEFSENVFNLLDATGGMSIHLTINATTDNPMNHGLVGRVVRAGMAEIASSAEPTVAKIDVDDEDGFRPIDLIADRIVSIQLIEFDGSAPTRLDMVKAIRDGRRERLHDINAYLGHAHEDD